MIYKLIGIWSGFSTVSFRYLTKLNADLRLSLLLCLRINMWENWEYASIYITVTCCGSRNRWKYMHPLFNQLRILHSPLRTRGRAIHVDKRLAVGIRMLYEPVLCATLCCRCRPISANTQHSHLMYTRKQETPSVQGPTYDLSIV